MDDILSRKRTHLQLSHPIGITVKRVWFLEGPPVNAITIAAVVSMDDSQTRLKIERLYQHLSPIDSSRVTRYIERPLTSQGPTILPSWFAHVNRPYMLRLH
jgi:hypothetical protein